VASLLPKTRDEDPVTVTSFEVQETYLRSKLRILLAGTEHPPNRREVKANVSGERDKQASDTRRGNISPGLVL
jgi:hypothetical protein